MIYNGSTSGEWLRHLALQRVRNRVNGSTTTSGRSPPAVICTLCPATAASRPVPRPGWPKPAFLGPVGVPRVGTWPVTKTPVSDPLGWVDVARVLGDVVAVSGPSPAAPSRPAQPVAVVESAQNESARGTRPRPCAGDAVRAEVGLGLGALEEHYAELAMMCAAEQMEGYVPS